LIAFSAYMLLLARTSASLATSYALVNPVVALLLGVTVGGETVSKWEWLSAGVIMVGVTLLFVSYAAQSNKDASAALVLCGVTIILRGRGQQTPRPIR
jgi:drug/metabolite transporter (DMT)-like permease